MRNRYRILFSDFDSTELVKNEIEHFLSICDCHHEDPEKREPSHWPTLANHAYELGNYDLSDRLIAGFERFLELTNEEINHLGGIENGK